MRDVIKIPLRTVSEANARDNRWVRARRTKAHRGTTRIVCGPALAMYREFLRVGLTVFVRLVRVSPGELDDDNLRVALKAVRDGVTDALGLIDDRDHRLVWAYDQHRKAKTHGVEIIVWNERKGLEAR